MSRKHSQYRPSPLSGVRLPSDRLTLWELRQDPYFDRVIESGCLTNTEPTSQFARLHCLERQIAAIGMDRQTSRITGRGGTVRYGDIDISDDMQELADLYMTVGLAEDSAQAQALVTDILLRAETHGRHVAAKENRPQSGSRVR